MAFGRPAHFDNEDQLQEKVNEYFEFIKGEFHMEMVTKTDKDGSVTESNEKVWDRYPEHPTITGLALFLGFESRQSVYDYEKKGDFSYIIKTARLKVENGYEHALFGDKPTGAIFALKNMGWVDTQTLANDKESPITTSVPVIKVYNTGPSLAGSEDDITE